MIRKTFFLTTVVLVFSFLISSGVFAQTAQPQPTAYNQKLQSSSLLFMENKGQVADAKGSLQPDILFTANSGGAKLYFSVNAIHYQFTKIEYPKGYDPFSKIPVKDPAKEESLRKQIKTSTHRFSLELQGANTHPTVSTEKQSEYTENYYLAQCPNGITGVHGYEKITYKNVYPKIDWVIYSKGGFMEYDFLVHPGGNPANIKLKIKDADSVGITATGELLMKTSLGEVREKAPVSYADGVATETHFKQLGNGMFGFDVEPQLGKELRIDPSVVWATYYGGTGEEDEYATTSDNFGNVYMTGITTSLNSIATGGFQNTPGGAYDAYLVKVDSLGTKVWSTYYGGNGQDYGLDCVQKNNSIYVSGQTTSQATIAFAGFQNVYAGNNDAFLVKFALNGSRIWATYYGGSGSDVGYSCGVDDSDNVFLSGYTTSGSGIAFNGFQNVYQNSTDAFLVKFTSTGNRVWGTYYGGSNTDEGYSCSIDTADNVYLTGHTNSLGLAANGFQNTLNGSNDAFLVKFTNNGNRIWSTYYGGSGNEYCLKCVVDFDNNVFITGKTTSATNIASNGFQNTYGGFEDAYLVKFNAGGNRIWSTYYGGGSEDFGTICSIDNAGNIYAGGYTRSTANIASNGIQNNYGGGSYDAFLVKYTNGGDRLWGTYYGGTADDYGWSCTVNLNGNVFFAGRTSSGNGIAFNGSQNINGGGLADAFLVRIDGGKYFITLCPSGSTSITSSSTGSNYQWQIGVGGIFTNITGPTAQSQTLQLINLPSYSYGYQYRCIVNNSYTDLYELKFANTWIGTNNSAWENPANWSCGVIPDGNTDIIINTGPVILNSNGICRTLTVRPGVSFTVTTGNTLTITH